MQYAVDALLLLLKMYGPVEKVKNDVLVPLAWTISRAKHLFIFYYAYY